MNELHLARRVKDTLDSGLKLSPELAARLGVARERALDRHRVVAEELALAGPGRLGARLGSPNQLLTRILLPAAFLVAAAVGLQQWQDFQRAARVAAQEAAEIEETDAGLLTGELPIKAYLDEDFQAWLKRSSE